MCRIGRHGRIGASVAATLMLASSQLFAQEAEAAVVKFNIESQPLAQALTTWADQAGLQIIWPVGDPVAYENSPPVRGRLEPMQALRALLEDTGLTYSLISGGRTVAIHGREPPAGLRTVADVGAAEPTRVADVRTHAAEQASTGAGAAQAARATGHASGGSSRAEEDFEELEEIVVTGTHIRGSGPIGSHVTTFTREDIQRSGYATPQDVLQLVPQNFGAVAAEIQGGEGNFSRGTGANLRGLGAGATLTLVNGRRQPASGLGDFVDIDSIPAAAIERIEVLPDGASAIYGSDAIGGVVNIVLRDSYSGAETSGRFASAGGDSNEAVASQVFGAEIGLWNAILGYQYYHRDALQRADRDFAASSDQRARGGTDFRGVMSNPGNILDPATFVPAFAIPANQDGTQLTPAQLLPGVANQSEPGERADLLPENTTHAIFLSTSMQVTDAVKIFADARVGDRDLNVHTNAWALPLFVPPENPFYVDAFGTGEPLFVGYSLIGDLGPNVSTAETRTWTATVGSDIALPADWSLDISATHGAERLRAQNTGVDFGALFAALFSPDAATAFNPFADGSGTNAQTLRSINAMQFNGGDSKLQEFSALAEGALFSGAGGEIRMALGSSYREEELETFVSFLDFQSRFSGKRYVTGVFGELTIPLFGGGSEAEGPRVDASLAGRYEQYNDFGSTFNPKVGLRFTPVPGVTLRGTWATSFRAPRLVDLNQPPKSSLESLSDPQSASGFSTVLVRYSGAELNEETATSWTAGIDWEPYASGPRLSLSYYDIDYSDRIITPGPLDYTQILFEEQQWAQVIERNPSPSTLAPLCEEAAALGYDCVATPPTLIADVRLRNIAALRTSGIDISVQQDLSTPIGEFAFKLAGNYILSHDLQLTSTSTPIDLLDTAGNPTDFRWRAIGTWRSGALSMDLAANYTDSYSSSVDAGSRAIGSYTTIDVGATLSIGAARGAFGDADISIRAVNVFDTEPPFYDSPIGFDASNVSPLGRLISAQVVKRW